MGPATRAGFAPSFSLLDGVSASRVFFASGLDTCTRVRLHIACLRRDCCSSPQPLLLLASTSAAPRLNLCCSSPLLLVAPRVRNAVFACPAEPVACEPLCVMSISLSWQLRWPGRTAYRTAPSASLCQCGIHSKRKMFEWHTFLSTRQWQGTDLHRAIKHESWSNGLGSARAAVWNRILQQLRCLCSSR